MSLYKELDPLSHAELILAFGGDPRYQFESDPDQLDVFYEEVAVKILSREIDSGVRYLLGRVDDLDPLRLQAALHALAFSKATLFDSEALFTRFLSHDDPLVLANAINGLRHYRIHAVKSQILPLLRHHASSVVGSVLEYLAHLFPEEAKPHLVHALRSGDPLLREWAVEIIDDTGADDLLIEVAPLLRDPHPDVRRAAHWTIAKESMDISIDGAGGNDSVNP
jgi:HEAT repeat protein